MIPVVTPAEMAEIDRQAPEPVEVLIARAAAAVARTAVELLGGTYGRRVVIVAGKGNNGADGRAAAVLLRRRGVRARVLDAQGREWPDGAADSAPPEPLPPSDLVIDAAYGTGFRGEYEAPEPGAPVLAVDIPSGVNGLTGQAGPGAVRAAHTVTFAALKPGLLLHPGAEHAGPVTVADIGLDTSDARMGLVEWSDVAQWLPAPGTETHKWKSALWVVAGSPGLTGAAHLCSQAALRAGAGVVRLGVPGSGPDPGALEVVGRPMPEKDWDSYVLEDSERMKALVLGPGIGRAEDTIAAARRLIAATPKPLVVDADGLFALGGRAEAAEILARRQAPTVLTPHEGEYARLADDKVGEDRVESARSLAADLGATVLLKGSTTVVAHPDGRVLFSTAGDARLATAGSGDVLSGVIGAFLARGLGPQEAAAAGAHVHGMAGHLGWRHGLVAGDLIDLLPAVLSND